MKIHTEFFRDDPQEAKEKVRDDLVRGRDALDRVEKILSRKTKDIVSAEDYDSASWAYKQADRNGYNRAIRDVLEIIKTRE